jgi:hypothetical protein
MEILIEYHLWIMAAALLGLVLLPKKQKKKKSVLTLIIVLAFSIGYELVMGEPVTEMPGRVNQYFNQSGPSKTENPRYHSTPEERMKKQNDSSTKR